MAKIENLAALLMCDYEKLKAAEIRLLLLEEDEIEIDSVEATQLQIIIGNSRFPENGVDFTDIIKGGYKYVYILEGDDESILIATLLGNLNEYLEM